MRITDFSRSTRVRKGEDWRIIEDIEVDNGVPLWWKGLNGPSRYSAKVHEIVKATIPSIWDRIAAKYLWARLVPDDETKLYDLMESDWTPVEVKTGAISSTTCIREGQLNRIWSKGKYVLVYFRTHGGKTKPPSFYVDKCIEEEMHISPEEYLKRSITVKTMLILRQPTMVNFFNTSNLRLHYNSSRLPYKALSRTRAIELFHKNPDWFETKEDTFQFGRHKIKVFHMWPNFLDE